MGWNTWTDEPTTEFTESELEEHDDEVRAEAERDFQNSEYWNDYLKKVLTDERKHILDILSGIDRQMAELVKEILNNE